MLLQQLMLMDVVGGGKPVTYSSYLSAVLWRRSPKNMTMIPVTADTRNHWHRRRDVSTLR
jgi:hypothetical protein